MSWLGRLFNRDAQASAVKGADVSTAVSSPGLLGMFNLAPSTTGIPITPITALQSAVVYACIKCLSEDIAKLPLRMQRELPDGGWQPERTHPVARLLARPNSWQTPFDFWRTMVASLTLRGNAVAAIRRGADGSPDGLIPVPWDRVSVLVSPAGWLFYHISHPQVGAGVVLHQDDVLHLRGMCLDGGYIGVSPIQAAPDAIGLALATQRHGATLFRQGTNLSGYLKIAGKADAAVITQTQQQWKDLYGGVENTGKVAVLQMGADFQKLQMTSEEAQFLGTRQFTVADICRLFRVPPHKVQDLSRATFSNIENQAQGYIDDALMPIAVSIEQECDAKLLFADERAEYGFRVDFDEMLRGDFKTRMEGYAIGITNGVLSPNEARGRERLNSYEGGQTFTRPLNMGGINPPGVAPSPPPAAPPAPLPPDDATVT